MRAVAETLNLLGTTSAFVDPELSPAFHSAQTYVLNKTWNVPGASPRPSRPTFIGAPGDWPQGRAPSFGPAACLIAVWTRQQT